MDLKTLYLAVVFCFGTSISQTYRQLSELEVLLEDGMLRRLSEFLMKNPEPRSTNCVTDILDWSNSLDQFWALNMLDANGKFPEGVLRGNLYSLGEFDECLAVTTERTKKRYKGKYCPMNLGLTKIAATILDYGEKLFPNASLWDNAPDLDDFVNINFLVGVCFPDSCSADELNEIINGLFESINITRPLVSLYEQSCSTTDFVEFDGVEIAAITILSLAATLLVLSTLYDLYMKFYLQAENKSRTVLILTSFSIYSNGKKVTTLNKTGNTLKCLNGMRVLSTFWVIMGHRYTSLASYPIMNTLDLLDWFKQTSTFIVVGGMLAVDTFLVLGGFFVAYIVFIQYERKKRFNLGLFYLHRFIRLWPAMAALILFQATIYYRIGNGPLWPREAFHRTLCIESWWSALLFIQNYTHPMSMCIGHLWYLCIDTQLYVLSPILIYPLLKSTKIGIPNLIFWIMVAQATCISIVYLNDWPALRNILDVSYWKDFYDATHARANVWLIGFAMGYFLFRCKNMNMKMNKFLVLVCWMITFTIFGAIIFGAKPLAQLDHNVNKLEDSTYTAFAKTGWAIGICWVIFACVTGYGGPINWFLSLDCWEILGRMSYSSYLVHFWIQSLVTGSTRVIRYFSQLDIVYLYLGDLLVVTIVAFLWVISFESPFLNIEKIFLDGGRGPKKQTLEDKEFPRRVEKEN